MKKMKNIFFGLLLSTSPGVANMFDDVPVREAFTLHSLKETPDQEMKNITLSDTYKESIAKSEDVIWDALLRANSDLKHINFKALQADMPLFAEYLFRQAVENVTFLDFSNLGLTILSPMVS